MNVSRPLPWLGDSDDAEVWRDPNDVHATVGVRERNGGFLDAGDRDALLEFQIVALAWELASEVVLAKQDGQVVTATRVEEWI